MSALSQCHWPATWAGRVVANSGRQTVCASRYRLAMLLRDVATFSRVRFLTFGSVDEVDADPSAVDNVAVVWTGLTRDENQFATVEIRGVIDRHCGLVWLPEDAEVEVVAGPQYAGQPEELIKLAVPVAAPSGSRGEGMVTPDGWPDLIWSSEVVFSPVQGWDDPELSVETLMCALAVAPEQDQPTRMMLLAALKARYAKVVKNPRTYPAARYPWRGRPGPGKDMLEYLRG